MGIVVLQLMHLRRLSDCFQRPHGTHYHLSFNSQYQVGGMTHVDVQTTSNYFFQMNNTSRLFVFRYFFLGKLFFILVCIFPLLRLLYL